MEPKQAVWPIADLKPHPSNPRTLSRARLEDLKRSLKADPDFLKVRPIIVNTAPDRRGIVIGGNMRLEAAKALGMTEVPVVEVEADDATEKRWLLKDNSHHGEWENEMLAELIMLDASRIEGAIPSDIMDAILNEYGPDTKASEEDQVEAIAAAEAITKPGDLWQLGDHMLYCGDACDPDSYVKLMGDDKARMIFTDPPYNVDYDNAGHDKIANDHLNAGDWAVFVRAWMARLHERAAGSVYICMSTKEWLSVMRAFIETGFHWSDTIMWIKHQFTLGRSDFQRQYEPIMVGRKVKTAPAEPILYGWPDGIDHAWNGGRDEGNAWFFRRPGTSPTHPTCKPVELVAKAIALSSNKGEIVLDPFLGGGSTMIACERLGRRGRFCEIAPGYVDAIIARYVGHTKNPHLIRNGESHEWGGAIITLEGVHDSIA